MINKLLGVLLACLAFLGALYKGAVEKNKRLKSENKALEDEAEALSRINEAVVETEKEFRDRENEIKKSTATVSRLKRKRVL